MGYEVRMSDSVENTGLDGAVFPTRQEAEQAAAAVNEQHPRPVPASVVETARAVNTTFDAWCEGTAPFKASHRIAIQSGEMVDVLLNWDGAAYTVEEWLYETMADYERDEDGRWTFQGAPFDGRVEEITG